MASYSFGGKIALVTGGGSGIGRATCQLLARDGARLLVTDINLEAARQTLSLLPGGGDHLALEMDVRQKSAVEGVIAASKDKFGAAPSLLVNAAGILLTKPFIEITEEEFDIMTDVHFKGSFIVSQVFARALLDEAKEAGEGRGAVVNISSITAKVGIATGSHYAANKGAIIPLTKTCALELINKGIRVNCVAPGFTDTPMTKDFNVENIKKKFGWEFPLGRVARPEEVAEVIVFLLSERSSYMVGACVEVTGGLCM